jgi:hypothetical protein
MISRAKLFYVQSQNAISMRGTPEDIQLAQKIVADFDRPRKTYRLTYTLAETEGRIRTGAQQYTLVVLSGATTDLKQGSRVPIVTGSADSGSSAPKSPLQSQVQYVDVGLNIQATVDGAQDSLRLRTKIEQSRLAEESSGVGAQDPVIRQTALESTSTLTPGKPLVLGSLDIPGSARHLEIEVVAEIVR